jgi:hypothetical protein
MRVEPTQKGNPDHMRLFKLSDGNHSIRSNHSISTAVADAVMRATGILALMGIAVIHLVQLVPTFRSTPLLGAAFVALIAGSVGVGARLVSAHLSRIQLWIPTLLLAAGAIAGYVFTRVLSTPFDNQDVGNWSCMLGMAALFVEGTLVGLSLYALSVVPHRYPIVSGESTLTAVPDTVGSLERVGHTNGSRV